MSKSAERAAELNRLIVEQGMHTRSMKTGWQPTEEEQAKSRARAARAVELVELLDIRTHTGPGAAEKYLNERIAAWLKANPLALTNDILVEKAAETLAYPNGVKCATTVRVQIGETQRGYGYSLTADDLEATHQRIVLKVPESVADYFRQQGRRQVQREIASILGYELKF